MTHPRDSRTRPVGSWDEWEKRGRPTAETPPAPEPEPVPAPVVVTPPGPSITVNKPVTRTRPVPLEVAPVEERTGQEWDLTIKQAAAYLNVSRSTMYKLARSGKVPSRQAFGQWRFSREWLRRWIDSGQAAAATARRDAS